MVDLVIWYKIEKLLCFAWVIRTFEKKTYLSPRPSSSNQPQLPYFIFISRLSFFDTILNVKSAGAK